MEEQIKFAVLHQFWNINGGTYDAIEYAYTLSKIGSTNLIFYRLKDCVFGRNDNLDNIKNGIIDLIHKKYNINRLNFNIIVRKGNIIDRNRYKSILAVDSVIVNKIPLFLFDKAFILADPYMSNISYYHKVKDLPNVYTYNEMPFFPAKVNYKFKFAFDIYKKYNKLENNTLISYKNDKEPFKKHITKIVNNVTAKKLFINGLLMIFIKSLINIFIIIYVFLTHVLEYFTSVLFMVYHWIILSEILKMKILTAHIIESKA